MVPVTINLCGQDYPIKWNREGIPAIVVPPDHFPENGCFDATEPTVVTFRRHGVPYMVVQTEAMSSPPRLGYLFTDTGEFVNHEDLIS